MKSFLIAGVLIIALPGICVAQTTATGTGTSSSNSRAGALAITGPSNASAQGGQGGSAQGGQATSSAGGGSVGNTNASIVYNYPANTRNDSNSNIHYHSSGSLKTVPTAAAPGLGSAGIESCNSSMSGAASALGWGVSLGGPVMDNECNLRLWARTLYSMGQRELVGAVLAQSPTINKAMQILDQQRQPNGQIVYNTPVVASGARTGASANSSGLVNQGCTKWSGGAKGVGTCLF